MTDPAPPRMKTVKFNGVVIGEVAASADRAEELRRTNQLIDASGVRGSSDLGLRMLGQAVAFSNVARRIFDSGLAKPPIDGLAIVPFVTNSAFCIELYLKTLGQLFSSPARGHKLLELLDGLPEDAQNLVNDLASRHIASDGQPMDASFRNTLKDLNNAFVEWRYSYEHDNISAASPFNIYALCDVLHAACLKKRGT